MHNVWNSDDQTRKDPNPNDHSPGSKLGGVPSKNKDKKGVHSNSLKSVRQKIFVTRTGRRYIIYQRSIKSISLIIQEEKNRQHARPCHTIYPNLL